MKPKNIIIAALVLGFVAMALFISGERKPKGPAALGSPAPDIKLRTFDGGQWSLSEQAGSVVVLNLWATW